MKILLMSLFVLSARASAIEVLGISDGDTLTVLQEGRAAKIRLANIDAPEKRQAYGALARQSLSDLCYRRDALVRTVTMDRYGRAVALVYCDGVDVSREQVQRGYAWVYTKYNKDSSLPALQSVAAAERRGLWAQHEPIAPWDFRRGAVRVTHGASETSFNRWGKACESLIPAAGGCSP